MSSQLNLLVKESFGSLEGLKSTLSAAAMGMMSSGWVWLVCDQSAQHLGYVATYGPGTMLVRSREQRHPDFISAQLHGPNKANLSRILGEPFDTKSSPKGAPGMSSMSRGPQIRSFHSTALAQSQIPMLQYQRSSRVSQSPLQWGPLEPLLTAGSPKGRVQPFSSKPPTEDHGENVEEGESIWESTEKKTTASPLLSQSFPNTVALKSLMNDRAFLPFDKGRLRGVGDDIMPLMCIR
jgi:superoxide dismutase